MNPHTDAIVVRSVRPSDIQALISICREAFPHSRRWRSRIASWLWWRRMTNSRGTEAWLAEVAKQPGGFLVVVREDQKEPRSGTLRILETVQAVGRNLLHTLRMIRGMRDGSRTAQTDEVSVSDVPRLSVRERLWLELIAVSPAQQGHGIGRRLLELADQRTVAAGRRGIRLLVDDRNVSARRLYERCGYALTDSRRGSSAYTKLVDGLGASQDAVATAGTRDRDAPPVARTSSTSEIDTLVSAGARRR